MAKETLKIEVNPNRVLIKITHGEWNSLFSTNVKRDDGTTVELFKDIPELEGYERRVKQNVSVGNIVAVGANLKGFLKGDIAIIDYLVTGTSDSFVGKHNGYRLVAIPAVTTYHTDDSPPYVDGRRAWVKGDMNELAPLIGFIRMGKVHALHPYVILVDEPNSKLQVTEKGLIFEETKEICDREVLAASPESPYKDGNRVIIRESNLFFRVIDNKKISVILEEDILGIV